MTKHYLSFLIFLFCGIGCVSQSSADVKIEKVYDDKADTTRNCYTVLYPHNRPWKGFVFLLPGFGETAARVIEQTELPKKLAKSGFLTIIPTFQDGVLSFGADSLSQQSFDHLVQQIKATYQLDDQPFFVGGYSIGGTCAIKYAENSIRKPKAVFAIDPPLDFERLYHSAKRDLRLSKNGEPNEENIYLINKLEKDLGGSPTTHLAAYTKLSPYSFSDTTQSAIKKLQNMPLRMYTEPDIHWWMKERRADLTSMNATECSAFINELNRLGNTYATLITTQNKGFRHPDHARHPHSWSIVDNDELIQWLQEQR